MLKNKLSIVTFVLSFVLLIISLKLFLNAGIFVDEYNISPNIINGGEFWLSMDWLRLLLLFLLCIASGINILKNHTK
ncbi:hypothetical protein [Clostridium tagluense]|uniref:Uncharacterized protein n=1 Tax=Clostridium tagluense TaxID=360422 RepID=A0A401UMT7_9CLOT|nr:hypothetical protein [Clostridium tagluense]GCD10849.1 hypothetical protein Ctaglu_24720 [Clostridium tagluense]